MKIRQDFVTNSSSTSYVIIAERIEDPDDLRKFLPELPDKLLGVFFRSIVGAYYPPRCVAAATMEELSYLLGDEDDLFVHTEEIQRRRETLWKIYKKPDYVTGDYKTIETLIDGNRKLSILRLHDLFLTMLRDPDEFYMYTIGFEDKIPDDGIMENALVRTSKFPIVIQTKHR